MSNKYAASEKYAKREMSYSELYERYEKLKEEQKQHRAKALEEMFMSAKFERIVTNEVRKELQDVFKRNGL